MQDSSRARIGSFSWAILTVGALGAVITLSCSEPAPLCQTYASPPTTDTTTPTSLRNDVLPIFVFSCTFSSCHGDRSPSANNGVYLGEHIGPTDAAAVRAALLGTPTTVPMPFVTPSDPSKSYLMHKIDGDVCTLGAQCKGSCGANMPLGSPLMAVDRRDVVRRWIAQGALDN